MTEQLSTKNIEASNIPTASHEKKDIQEKKYSFEELETSKELTPQVKELLESLGDYIDINLGKDFSKQEKEKIKLAFVNDIIKSFEIKSLIGDSIKQFLEPLKNLVQTWASKESLGEKVEQTKAEYENFKRKSEELFKKFGLEGKMQEISQKIEKLKEAKKKQKKEFKSVKDVFSALESPNNKTDEEFFNQVKGDLIEIGRKLKTGEELGEEIKDTIQDLPFGEKIMDFIKDIAKKYPIVGIILSFFFGKDFLNESVDKQKNSLKNLKNYTQEKDFPLRENISPSDIDNLSPKKLEKFYKYLDSKEIDYTSSSFWEELLTGNTKNEKIKKIHELLKNDKGKILEKTEKLEDLVKKLNSLKELENKEEQQKLQKKVEESQQQVESGKKDLVLVQKQRQQLEIQAKKAEKQLQETTSAEEQQKIKEKLEQVRKKAEELKRQEEYKQRKLKEAMERARKLKEEKEFIESVNNISKLPAEIVYKGKKLRLDIENNQIVLGKDRYKVSIMAEIFGKNTEKFEKIEFKNGNFILNGNEKNPITKSQVIELIDKLKSGKNFEYNGVTEKPFVGKVNYKLTISKI